MSEIVIEIASQTQPAQTFAKQKETVFRPAPQPPINGSVLFQPLAEKLRGRWTTHKILHTTMHAALQSMPSPIPGEMVGVNIATKTVRKFDPLSLPENADLWNAMKEHYRNYQEYFGMMNKLMPGYEQAGCDNTVLKTWLYWMRRIVDAGVAIVVPKSAPLPNADLIKKLPGLTQIGQFNETSTRPMYRECFDDFFTLRPDWEDRIQAATKEPTDGKDAMTILSGKSAA
jgi:hypothetical protein